MNYLKPDQCMNKLLVVYLSFSEETSHKIRFKKYTKCRNKMEMINNIELSIHTYTSHEIQLYKLKNNNCCARVNFEYIPESDIYTLNIALDNNLIANVY